MKPGFYHIFADVHLFTEDGLKALRRVRAAMTLDDADKILDEAIANHGKSWAKVAREQIPAPSDPLWTYIVKPYTVPKPVEFTPHERKVQGGTLLVLERLQPDLDGGHKFAVRWKGGTKKFLVAPSELEEMEHG